ncbi:MAG: FxLYD domain-containing protein, partial [Candidatus Nanopelagicales bacterium]
PATGGSPHPAPGTPAAASKPQAGSTKAASKSRGWLVIAVIGVILMVLVGWLVLRPSGGGEPSPTPTPSASATATAPSAPASDQLRDGDWLLQSYRLASQAGALTVSGTVRNTGDATASADLQVWLYEGGQSLGSVTTTVTDVPAGGTVDVTMTGDATWQAGQKVLLLEAS